MLHGAVEQPIYPHEERPTEDRGASLHTRPSTNTHSHALEPLSASAREHQNALAAFVRARRTSLGLTPSELASRAGWSPKRVLDVEQGTYGLPTIVALSRLAQAMNSSIYEMLVAAGFDVQT